MPSLVNLNRKEEKVLVVAQENLPNKSYSFDDLQRVWRDYQVEVSAQMNKSIILKGEIRLENQTIFLLVNNLIQKETFNSFKEELMAFIRRGLENYSVQIECNIKHEDEARQMYTSQEKFKHLVEKYPILQQLKDEFGLEANF